MTSTTPSTNAEVDSSSPTNGTASEAELRSEDAALAEQIYTELMTAPPFACPISYTGPGDEETVNRAMTALKVHALLLRRRHPWLAFDAPDSIVFHSDYDLALREIGERVGRPCKATSESTGVGLAMVVHLEDKCVAVFDAGIALGIVDEADEARRDLCLDTALHELCHVYDYSRKRRLLSDEFLKRKVSPIDAHVFTAADAAWSEYFANKYSNSACSSPDMHPRYLADVVPAVVDDVRAAIRAYRSHVKLHELLPLCEQKIRFAFQCFGYAAGRLAANRALLEDVAPESAAALRAAGLWDVWLSVFTELGRLDERRDAWTSLDALRPLMGFVENTFRILGLRYQESGDRVRVDIPFTPETMPDNPLAQLLARAASGRQN